MTTKAIRLRDYQEDIRRRLSEEWRSHRSVMVQMPTGTGKTHVLAAVAGNFPATGHGGGGVWVIAHRRELVAQIEETLAGYGMRGAPFRVMSIQWLSRHWEDAGDTPRLVVIDEAHHAVAETYRTLWDRYPAARFLGLTATPCRMSGKAFTDLFDTLVTSWGIAEFIERGRLSPFDYVSIRQGSEEQRLIASLSRRGADGDYQIKEMDHVLNRDTSVARLYGSMERFAAGKKGIVYAISIAHARRIAEYYGSHGASAAAIDSRTPAAERRRLVEDFRAGRIRVLVNVDIFSEGFDCPDVEFVQMARPTLSLAKYLQQVGRGLRMAEGKEACVLIDNVGLWRLFGLPTEERDWEAMFRGVMAGRGRPGAGEPEKGTAMMSVAPTGEAAQEWDMEVIVSHERLLADIARQKGARPPQPRPQACGLKAWQDPGSGLWGLRRGRTLTTEALFAAVLDIRHDMAAVRFRDGDCGIVGGDGEAVWKKGGCRSVAFLRNRLLHATGHGREYYVDLCSLRAYPQRPKVRRYGNVELLETGRVYYSRTKAVYANGQGGGRPIIHWWGFYLTIYDEDVPFPGHGREDMPQGRRPGHACILEGDDDTYYWLYRRLADGSIVVMDNDQRYYHAAGGRPGRYIGCRASDGEWDRCRAEIDRLAGQAERERLASEARRTERRRLLLARSGEAVPFRSGMKWGLKVEDHVVVPPVYRMVSLPVGMYCAVEKNYGQWGVISIDGTVLVEPKYTAVSIEGNGTALLTNVTGKKVSVKLRQAGSAP